MKTRSEILKCHQYPAKFPLRLFVELYLTTASVRRWCCRCFWGYVWKKENFVIWFDFGVLSATVVDLITLASARFVAGIGIGGSILTLICGDLTKQLKKQFPSPRTSSNLKNLFSTHINW